jgi:hypothetical protein
VGPESRCSKGKIVQEEIDASKEKGSKKEETLEMGESKSRDSFPKASRKDISRGFLLSAFTPCDR